MDMYEKEIVELEIWMEKNKPNRDWAKRVEGVHDLLILQQHGISLFEQVVREAGYQAIFYPESHCELNCIEYFQAVVKRYTYENCSYSFHELGSIVLAGLDSVSLRLFVGL